MKKLLGIFAMMGALSLVGCGEAICGDGEVQNPNDDGVAEQCDDGNNTPGDLCDANCQEEAPPPECGNGIIEAGEDCEGADLGGEDCVSQGFAGGGTLACDAACNFDTAQCVASVCGNGALEDDGNGGFEEACDDGGAGVSCAATCDAILATSARSNDVNGVNPGAANTAIHGEGDVDFDADGIADVHVFLALLTDNANLCADITASGGGQFITNLFAGTVAGTTVNVASFSEVGISVLVAGTAVVSDGAAINVDGGFTISDGTAATVDTTFGSDFNGIMTIDEVNGANITGAFDVLQTTEFITGGTIAEPLRGEFQSTDCPVISTDMQDIMAAVFGL